MSETCSTTWDDDCDNDTNDENALGCTYWYYDYDGDTYGLSNGKCMCASASPYTATKSGDCNDNSAAYNSGAGNCGLMGTITTSSATATFVPEISGDYPTDIKYAGDMNGDGIGDLLLGMPYQDSAGTDTGTVYLIHGPVTGSVVLANAAAKFRGEAVNDYAGYAWAAGDTDGDGWGDVLVFAKGSDVGAPDAGAAFVFLGPQSGTRFVTEAEAFIPRIETANDAYARPGAVGAGGDINCDGYDDVAINPSANYEDFFWGPVSAVAEGSPDLRLNRTTAFVSLDIHGDVDGDGCADLLFASESGVVNGA